MNWFMFLIESFVEKLKIIISFFAQLLFCAKQRYKSFCEGALFSGINIFTAILAKLQGMMNKVFFFIINFNKKHTQDDCNI